MFKHRHTMITEGSLNQKKNRFNLIQQFSALNERHKFPSLPPLQLQFSPFHPKTFWGQCCKVIPGLTKDLGVNTLNTSSQEQSAISPGLNRLKSSP